jgi:hypothetical protein
VTLPVGVLPDPDTVTLTETDCAAVTVVEAGVTVTVGVVGFGCVVFPPPPPQADIPIEKTLARRSTTVPKPFFTLSVPSTGVHWAEDSVDCAATDATGITDQESEKILSHRSTLAEAKIKLRSARSLCAGR